MYKLISIFLLINLMAVAKGQGNCNLRNFDLFAELMRQQNEHNIQDYDIQINAFIQKYSERLDDIIKNSDFLMASSIQKEKELTRLQFLSDDYQRCFNKYRNYFPKLTVVKSGINECIKTASSKLTNLLSNLYKSRNELSTYYNTSFEKNISYCQAPHITKGPCYTRVDSDCNATTSENQKEFATALKNSECSANTHITNVNYCTFGFHNHTISSMSETSTLINICISNIK